MPDMELAKGDWHLIVDRIKQSLCVPFLGAGASLGCDSSIGLPSGSDVARKMAEECNYPGSDRDDLLKVSQYCSIDQDPRWVREYVKRNICVKGAEPSIIHRTIAELPFSCIISTNYDDFMEEALRKEGKSPVVQYYNRNANESQDLPTPSINNPLVYKIHGTVDDLNSLILTEDDVIDFLCRMIEGKPGLPKFIKTLFDTHSILFIGYGLRDWNIRVLLRALRGRSNEVCCFAIQRKPNNAGLAQEWEKSIMHLDRRQSIRVYDIDAKVFIEQLRRQFSGN